MAAVTPFPREEPLIAARDLVLGYDGEVVVSQLDFTVYPGDYICILGENGSGKSTLIKALLGLLKPYGGKIRFAPTLKKWGVGYLPQQTLLQKDFPSSVREVVLSGFLGQCGMRPF